MSDGNNDAFSTPAVASKAEAENGNETVVIFPDSSEDSDGDHFADNVFINN